ncbi:MAG TPA: patatin-like phospholipase family protein [Casimicrobiaceae bacterium]|nr:patatin-like phospholipase family protein [Casimicrobiaceae bacterium]
MTTAILLGGGGARAAYQAGALRAIARIHGRDGPLPFPVVCGTSAGAINAAALAIHADDFRCGVSRLVRWWRNVRVSEIYRTDFASLSRHSAQFLASIISGTRPPPGVAALLDNTPLAELLARGFDFSRVARQIDRGHLRALSINATSYTTGHAVSFFQGAPTVSPWRRTRRRGEPAALTPEHLLASAAIPFLFPAARVGDDYFMDGSVRQIAPLSPPLNLGARRILVLAIGQFNGQRPPPRHEPAEYPSFAQAAGHALSTIFLDNLAADVERMMLVNRLLDLVAPDNLADNRIAHVDALVLAPSRDLGAVAMEHAERLPSAVRTLMRALGSTEGTGANLTSYLLFDRAYCRALLALGYADTMARHAEVQAFLAGAAHATPLLPANFG